MWRDVVSMTVIAAAQAIDIRSGGGKRGAGTVPIH